MNVSLVEPVLASALWNLHKSKYGTSIWHGDEETGPKLLTGNRSIDDALVDGLSYGHGSICSLSFETGSAKQEVGMV